MALDSITITALAAELREQVAGAKIEKVQQPERDTVLLSLRGQAGRFPLLLCGGVGTARAHVTEASFENPAQPPMFCMLLRKHLTGARIAAVEQPERERILCFSLDAYDEMGAPVQKQLHVEMMGRASNLVLVDGDSRILDCLRRVDAEMNAARQLLPGLIYRMPTPPGKPDFFSLPPEERRRMWQETEPHPEPAKWLMDHFSGLSPLICRELAARCGSQPEGFPQMMDALADSVAAGEFVPWMLLEEGKPKDFSFMRITQYGEGLENLRYSSFSALLDAFYTGRGKAEEMRRRTQALRKTVKNARDRALRKSGLQEEELKKTASRETKRRWGDLITANLYRAPKGKAASMTVEDFYASGSGGVEGCPTVTIPLDPLKTPQQNAAQYYKEYAKAKTAEKYLTGLLQESRRDAAYLDSVLDELDRAQSETEVAAIRRELAETGYLRERKKGKKERTREAEPLRCRSSGGYEILVGRGNVQNDYLTTKVAGKGDLWFHVQKIHGSHVILRCGGEDPDPQSIQEAATLAATHSQASKGGKVPVDYTRVKFVKKPAGALPGMVTYSAQTTIVAEADESLVERLGGGH